MDRYQLATLASWAGGNGIRGRKRMQKVVFFLQAAGCDLGCDFTLHHYGPYSRDVSDACDEMVAAGLLQETKESNQAGAQFNYFLPQATQQLLDDTNRRSPDRANSLTSFEPLAKQLLGEELWQLELGSTILYFYEVNEPRNWDTAVRDACAFKNNYDATHPTSVRALNLAKSVYQRQQAQF